MRAHRGGGTDVIASHDRDHDAVVLGMRFRKPSEIAELGPAERLHPLAASCRKASRTGVRDTSKRPANDISSSFSPGRSTPVTIISAMERTICSTVVPALITSLRLTCFKGTNLPSNSCIQIYASGPQSQLLN